MSELSSSSYGSFRTDGETDVTQRVKEGVKVAKEKGFKLGRAEANKNKIAYALELNDKGEHISKGTVDITGISRATLYRKIKEREQEKVI